MPPILQISYLNPTQLLIQREGMYLYLQEVGEVGKIRLAKILEDLALQLRYSSSYVPEVETVQ